MISLIDEENWKELKRDLKKSWNYVTEDEWEDTRGDLDAITELIQYRYGQNKDEIFSKVSDLYRKHGSWPGRPEVPYWAERYDTNTF